MSPKSSSLAFEEVREEQINEESFVPTLNLIINKRAPLIRDMSTQDLAISISGSISVSF